jgi:hypothetical protein
MTPRSLFIIILRVIGLFLLIDILRIVPQLLSTMSVLLRTGETGTMITTIIFAILVTLIYFYVVRYILFRADKLVDKLSLDKNFTEDKFELNIHRSTVIKIAVVIIGGITLVEYFVPLILELYIFIQSKGQGPEEGGSVVTPMNIVKDVLMVLIGFFLVSNSRTITNWTERKLQK